MLYVIVVNVNNFMSLILFATPRSVSRSPVHFMFVDVRKCRDCKRHLRAGLFNLNSDRCFACIRKRNVVRKYKSFKSSVNNTFLVRHIPAGEDAIDPLQHLHSVDGEIRETLRRGVEIHTSCRWVLSSNVVFERTVEDISQETRFQFSSYEHILLRADEIPEQVESAVTQLLSLVQEMTERESNFIFKKIFSVTVRLARFHPIGGSSYIPTPEELANKMALVNVRNKDSRCFLYAIASAIHPAKTHTERPSKYEKFLSDFNIKGLKFPLTPEDISKFEDLNPEIAVTVLHYDADRVIVPLVHSSHIGRKHEVNLLLLAEECQSTVGNLRIAAAVRNYRYHYTWIKNPSRLLSSVTKHDGAVLVCFNCFRRFYSEDKFNRHRPDCLKHAPLRISFPSSAVRKPKRDEERLDVDDDDVDDDDDEIETLEEALGIDADVRVVEDNGKKPENILEFTQFKNTYKVPFVLYV